MESTARKPLLPEADLKPSQADSTGSDANASSVDNAKETEAAVWRCGKHFEEILQQQQGFKTKLDDGNAVFDGFKLTLSVVEEQMRNLNTLLTSHTQLLDSQAKMLKEHNDMYASFRAFGTSVKVIERAAIFIMKFGGAAVIIWGVWEYAILASLKGYKP